MRCSIKKVFIVSDPDKFCENGTILRRKCQNLKNYHIWTYSLAFQKDASEFHQTLSNPYFEKNNIGNQYEKVDFLLGSSFLDSFTSKFRLDISVAIGITFTFLRVS